MKKFTNIFFMAIMLFFMVGCNDAEDLLPSLELVGDSIMEVEQYSDFVEPGVGIIGDFDLDVTTGVVMKGFVGVATMWMMVIGG